MNQPAPRTSRISRGSVRRVDRELLDELPENDAGAMRSRRDLRRVNAWMGHARLLQAAISANGSGRSVRKIAEIGSGDGTLMLRVAQRLKGVLTGVTLDLVDRQSLLQPHTAAGFEALDWIARPVQADAVVWLGQTNKVELITANLFLHHFEDSSLADMFAQVCGKTDLFVACEPRRFAFPWLAGQLTALIGCSRITRHDAVASVRAGFRGQELSRLWPEHRGWRLEEVEAGLFSHRFVARRK